VYPLKTSPITFGKRGTEITCRGGKRPMSLKIKAKCVTFMAEQQQTMERMTLN
jgi:hypothetical protein